MKIRIKFRLITVFSMVMVIVICLTLLYSYQQMREVIQKRYYSRSGRQRRS